MQNAQIPKLETWPIGFQVQLKLRDFQNMVLYQYKHIAVIQNPQENSTTITCFSAWIKCLSATVNYNPEVFVQMHIVSVNMHFSSSTGKKDANLSLQHIRSYTACKPKFQNITPPPQPTNVNQAS